MSFNVYIASAYAVICAISAWVTLSVRSKTLPSWSTLFSSVVSMMIWSLAVKRSTLSLVQLSALFDVVGCLAYFTGYVLCGESVTSIQWVGIFLMIFAIYLINS